MFRTILVLISLVFFTSCLAQKEQNLLQVGAARIDSYLPLLQGKSVGLVVNNTSVVKDSHVVDFLRENGVNVSKVFAPEHGFRGDVSAGGEVNDGVDTKTGLPVFSLYGKAKKPSTGHLESLDMMVFDIQDVGCRFYTYISTLHLVMEACAENGVPLIVLDRPNPNGDYIAGPIRKDGFESFVGMDPIPIVHGCTVGELAQMINGEGWLENQAKCELIVVPVKNYDHKMRYSLPVRPSPNLPNDLAVRLYPSLCFFEATSVSVGRGTDFPFQVLGGLRKNLGEFQFTPHTIPGVAIKPLNQDQVCYGVDLRQLDEVPQFTLKFFLDFYKKYEDKEEFLTRERWLNLLVGTDDLINQIRAGKTENEILESWEPELKVYQEVRKKYLLYPDFE